MLAAGANHSASSLGKRKHQTTSSGAPSLYPVYLPYQTQHKLLGIVQQALERAYYNFAMRVLPDLVEEEWECAESVELNLWARIFSTNQERFSQEGVGKLGKPLSQLFDSVAQLRHTAVHRVRVSAN